MTYPYLSVLGLLPIVVAIVVAMAKPLIGRIIGLIGSLLTLVYAALIVTYSKMMMVSLTESMPWLKIIGSRYALTLDGLGLMMVAVTVVLVPVVLIAEWKTGVMAKGRLSSNTFVALVLLVQSFSLFSFMSADLLVFFIFFEATLIPMFFLIGGWTGTKRGSGAMKFLLFGLAGGLIMLFGVIGTAVLSTAQGGPTLNFANLAVLNLGDDWIARMVFISFFAAFALKAPLVPGHIWLPDAAEESTPGGAALMVGVLDKLGTFGMIRVCIGIFPDQAEWARPVILVLALISIIYGGLAAIGSKNLMRLIAYTSISHFGFIVMGIFALTSQSLTGSIFYMVNHSLATTALFLVIGYLISRRGSAEVTDFGGVAKVAPLAAGFTLVASFAVCALPGTSSFISEFLVVAGTWSRYPVIAAISVIGVVLAAVYVLWTYQRVMTGPVTYATAQHVTSDLSWHERWALIPLVALILLLGFWPQPAMDEIKPTTEYYMVVSGAKDPVATIEEGR